MCPSKHSKINWSEVTVSVLNAKKFGMTKNDEKKGDKEKLQKTQKNDEKQTNDGKQRKTIKKQ